MSLPILRQLLHNRRRALAIWAFAISAVSAMYAGMYPMMEDIDMQAMIDSLPPAMVEALGYDELGSAAGYIGSAVYGLVGLALCLVFAIGTGARLIAGHEEDGHLELEFTSPIPRAALFAQRFAGLWVQLSLVVLSLLAVTALVDLVAALEVGVGRLAVASFQLFLLLGFFGSVAFGFGAGTGRRGLALGVTSALAVVSWMFNAIGPTIGLDWMPDVSPIGWYMDDNPITRGFHPLQDGLLFGGSVLAAALGWIGFRRRDVMT
jgi:ABC-2 type transport system permease protein